LFAFTFDLYRYAAALYACSNVMQEVLLLDGAPTTEVLAAVGGFGAVISGVQCSVFESGQLAKLNAVAGLAGFGKLAGFAVSLFAMYSLVPDVLRRCGAAAFNIGMLSSDLWAVVARVLFFGGFGGSTFAALAFGASFITVSGGLVLFAAAGDPLPPERKGRRETRYFEVLDDEEVGVLSGAGAGAGAGGHVNVL
jgi:solute carrier family 35 protein F1/2